MKATPRKALLNNVGGKPAPVDLHLRYADGTRQTLHQTLASRRAR